MFSAWTQQYSINDQRQHTVMDQNTTNENYFVKECLQCKNTSHSWQQKIKTQV